MNENRIFLWAKIFIKIKTRDKIKSSQKCPLELKAYILPGKTPLRKLPQGGTIFLGGGGQFCWGGLFPGVNFPGSIFPGGIFPSTLASIFFTWYCFFSSSLSYFPLHETLSKIYFVWFEFITISIRFHNNIPYKKFSL